jgi:hypothetical protein
MECNVMVTLTTPAPLVATGYLAQWIMLKFQTREHFCSVFYCTKTAQPSAAAPKLLLAIENYPEG